SRGVPLPFASLTNERSLIYVANLADAVISSIGTRGTFLVADGELLSVADLVRRLSRALGKKSHLFAFPPYAFRFVAPQIAETFVIEPNLKWTPPFSVDEGLAATAEWFSFARRAPAAS